MTDQFSERYQNDKTFENLLTDRFSRFDYAIAEYLIERTKSFFENFISKYLGIDSVELEKYGDKEIPKAIFDHEITGDDLHNFATSNFGLVYFVIVDEVIVNKIKEVGKHDYRTIKENFNVLINLLDGIISNLEIINNELFYLKGIPNRLDQLKDISFYRNRMISDIFKGGVNTDSYLIKQPNKIDYAIEEFQKNNFSSVTFSYTILPWLLLREAFVYSDEISDDKFSSNIFLDNNLRSFNERLKGFEKIRSKLQLQEIGLDLLFKLFKFAVIFSVFYLIFVNKNILLNLNINDEYHWIVSILLITLMYLGIRAKGEIKTASHDYLIRKLDMIDLFNQTQTIMHLDYYHPETLKSKLLSIEKKGAVVPSPMFLILAEHIAKNELIETKLFLDERSFYEEDFITSSKDTGSLSHDDYIRTYGDIEITREKRGIKWKLKDEDESFDLRWVDEIEISISMKPIYKFWKIKKGDENKNKFVEESNISFELCEIKGGFYSSSLNLFYENSIIRPQEYHTEVDSMTKQIGLEKLSNDLEDNFIEALPEIDGMGYIRLIYDHEPQKFGLHVVRQLLTLLIGLKDNVYEKFSDRISTDEIEKITFIVEGGAYISNRHDTPSIFIDINSKNNVFSISEMTFISSSNSSPI